VSYDNSIATELGISASADIVDARLPVAEYILKSAGSMIVDCYHHTLRTPDYVAQLTKAVESMMIKNMLQLFPEDGYTGVHVPRIESQNGIEWLLSPIDGINNFMRGIPFIGTQIAIMSRGTVLYSSFYQPLWQEQVTAKRGFGTTFSDFKNGQQLSMSVSTRTVDDSMIVFDGVVASSDASRQLMSVLGSRVNHFRVIGSATHDFSLIASGKLDGLVGVTVNPRDVLPGVLMVEESGGKVTDINGQPFTPESRSVLATNGLLHDELLAIMNGEAR
jgi:myo-inositol-1(or 4)-monophosphatase